MLSLRLKVEERFELGLLDICFLSGKRSYSRIGAEYVCPSYSFVNQSISSPESNS